MNPIRLPDNPRVLVVVLRRLGDVLLTTPLIRSIKRAYPGAAIEALVFAGTEGILAGNPDLASVIAMPQRPSAGESLSLLLRLGRRYDLALSTQSGDRPTTLAWVAGRQSAGLLEASGFSASLKGWALNRSYATDRSLHRIRDTLRLAELLGIPALPEIVCPAGAVRPGLVPAQPYAVVHAAPMFTYKRWRIDGWRLLVAALRARGLATVVTGGTADRTYLDEVWYECDVTRLDGKLAWPELAELIGGARVYIGPDTAVTHLAAAKATQTVALYGPTDPRIWGPWPIGGLDPPWAAAGTIQHRGNVWLVQNPLPCLPCQLEGCERRIDSYSQCLDELSVPQVMAAVDQALAMRQAA
ncbi:MAG TPA: glycosyltransferase family 9 protein [Xanthobacteraceae bacterium]|nr:glycosyltransferase family 9 protein [Xanthobacteraceae bacterium]